MLMNSGGVAVKRDTFLIIQELERCPTINDVNRAKSETQQEQLTRDIAQIMWGLSSRSTDQVRDAFREIAAARHDAVKIVSNDLTGVQFRKLHPSALPPLEGGGQLEYGKRNLAILDAASLNEVWVDRFLFDPPDLADGPTFFSFSSLGHGQIDPMDPVRIDGNWIHIYGESAKIVNPPQDFAEFEFYQKNFPRRQPDLDNPADQYQRLKSVIDEIESCPSPGGSWLDADPEGFEEPANVFLKVSQSMSHLRTVPTKDISDALSWLHKRRRHAWLVLTHVEDLSKFFSDFPLHLVRESDESWDHFAKRLIDHNDDVCFNELWLARFLFKAPTTEVIVRPHSPYPCQNTLPIWHTFGKGRLEEGDKVNRSYPLDFSKGYARLSDDFKWTPWDWDPYKGGEEFSYYAKHYARR